MLTGTGNDDVIVALGGNDRVNGGEGDDVVCMGGGADVGKGGPGNDLLDAGRGKDRCVGGPGADQFRGCEQADGDPPPPPETQPPPAPETELPPSPETEPPLPPNQPPTGGGDAASTGEDEAMTISVLANDSDPDGDPLTVNGVGTAGTTGAVSPTTTGSAVSYDPRGRFDSLLAGETATDSFTYSVSDGRGGTATASVAVVVNGAQEPPRLTTTAGATLIFEDEIPGPFVDSGLTLTDSDDRFLEGATVRISQGFQSGDELNFLNTPTIDGAYNPDSGVLTLTGAGEVFEYQAALRSVRIATTDPEPTTSKTVEFTVTDGIATAVATKAISVEDYAPGVSTGAGSTPFTEGGLAVTVDPSLTVFDPDESYLEGATVRISQGFQSGDELIFGGQGLISGTYDTGTGVLTLSGTDTVAAYQAALRSIQFDSTNSTPTDTKTVEFTVTDGTKTSNTATRTISVTPVP